MGNFIIKISCFAPYPKEYETRQTASGFPTAVARALRAWRKEVKGKKIKEVSIKAIKL